METESHNMLAIASDSVAVVRTIHNLSKGVPPRSHIERRIKAARRSDKDIGVLWVRSHIGIPGNERADERAEYESFLGEVALSPQEGTEEGLRALGKAVRKAARVEAGYGQRRVLWDRHALSAYTWLRTDKGPQKKWLHYIGKAANPACACGHSPEDERHIMFECPRFRSWRDEYLGERRTWEELDKQFWIKRGEGDKEKFFEGTEAFFGLVYGRLKTSRA